MHFLINFLINFSILTLLNKRQLEKLKEKWWKNDEMRAKCDKSEDQSNGISIDNIGGVFIVIFVGIGMACITLIFEYWWYKYRKTPKIIDVSEAPTSKKDIQRISNKLVSNSGLILSDRENSNIKSNNPLLKHRFQHYPTPNTRNIKY